MQVKSDLERENEKLASQLIWLTGIVHGVIERGDISPRVRETLTKALKAIGADRWRTTLDPTS